MSDDAPPSVQRPSIVPTILTCAILAVVTLALLFQLAFLGPRQFRTFDEFGLKLSSLSTSVRNLSLWTAEYWWVVGPITLAVIIAAGAGFTSGNKPSRRVGFFLAFALMMILLAVNAIVFSAIFGPLTQLQEGLKK